MAWDMVVVLVEGEALEVGRGVERGDVMGTMLDCVRLLELWTERLCCLPPECRENAFDFLRLRLGFFTEEQCLHVLCPLPERRKKHCSHRGPSDADIIEKYFFLKVPSPSNFTQFLLIVGTVCLETHNDVG